MRRSISFTTLFFVMLSVLVSCYQSHKRELDLAYTLAESKPDSALVFFLTLTMRHPSWIFLFFGGRIVTFAPV